LGLGTASHNTAALLLLLPCACALHSTGIASEGKLRRLQITLCSRQQCCLEQQRNQGRS
jgi:hypothetical protein